MDASRCVDLRPASAFPLLCTISSVVKLAAAAAILGVFFAARSTWMRLRTLAPVGAFAERYFSIASSTSPAPFPAVSANPPAESSFAAAVRSCRFADPLEEIITGPSMCVVAARLHLGVGGLPRCD